MSSDFFPYFSMTSLKWHSASDSIVHACHSSNTASHVSRDTMRFGAFIGLLGAIVGFGVSVLQHAQFS